MWIRTLESLVLAVVLALLVASGVELWHGPAAVVDGNGPATVPSGAVASE